MSIKIKCDLTQVLISFCWKMLVLLMKNDKLEARVR